MHVAVEVRVVVGGCRHLSPFSPRFLPPSQALIGVVPKFYLLFNYCFEALLSHPIYLLYLLFSSSARPLSAHGRQNHREEGLAGHPGVRSLGKSGAVGRLVQRGETETLLNASFRCFISTFALMKSSNFSWSRTVDSVNGHRASYMLNLLLHTVRWSKAALHNFCLRKKKKIAQAHVRFSSARPCTPCACTPPRCSSFSTAGQPSAANTCAPANKVATISCTLFSRLGTTSLLAVSLRATDYRAVSRQGRGRHRVADRSGPPPPSSTSGRGASPSALK